MTLVVLKNGYERRFYHFELSSRARDDIRKQVGFVDGLVDYNTAQWREFFRVLPLTVQSIVEDLGPHFIPAAGVCLHAY